MHLADFPVADKTKIDKQLTEDVRLAMKVSSMGRAARAKAGIKVRQPVACVVVSVASSGEQRSLEQLKSQVLEELNVKDLKFGSYREVAELDGRGYVVSGLEQDIDEKKGYKALTGGGVYLVAVPTELSPELQAEGMAREVVRRLQTMRRAAGFDIADHIVTYYQGDDYIRKVMEILLITLSRKHCLGSLLKKFQKRLSLRRRHKLSGHNILLGVKKVG